ncbi:hypothetical protein [Catellatospora sp. NPDC049609]|uniref:hypothetical protein n=1 Tax=Catellatospora sp. NPDC049609 TaxID=3155505 RepID=UPI0034195357
MSYPPPAPDYPPPYPGQPAPYTPAPAPKKSRVGMWVAIVIGVLIVCCGGGGIGAYFFFKDTADKIEGEIDGIIASASAQAQAAKITVVAPSTLAGRAPVTDPELKSLATTMKTGFQAAVPAASNAVAGFYGDPAKKDLVMMFAASARMGNPEKELDDAFTGMATSGLTATGIAKVPAGPLGGTAKCGSATSDGVPMAICAWADSGSLGMVVWYFKTVDEVKAELIEVRGQIEQKG